MLETLKSQVEAVLADEPETRNSDIGLLIAIWRKFYGIKMAVNVSQLYELPREDNVKRIRAKFQNEEGKYLPTELKIALKRGILEDKWRAFMGYAPKNYMQENSQTDVNYEQSKVPAKQPNVLGGCPTCGGGLYKQSIYDTGLDKVIEKIHCLKCGKQL